MEEIIEDAPTHGDMYLKFPDEATAFAALYAPVVQTVVTYDEEGVATSTEEVIEGEFVQRYAMSIDTIGVIYRATGNTLLGEDGEYPETAPMEGWHVNLRGSFTPEKMEALEPFVVTPANPVRVWA